jgi:Asp-tRNA(Asn)/Glu-tRNA(Gln) amidotransferase A subunit family amidase
MADILADAPKPALRSFFAATPAFADGSDTPRAFLERCIETIERDEPQVGAFVNTNFVGARAAADQSTERWKAGNTLSLIDGMPVGIKDVMESADMPTEQGSPLFAGWRGGRDCAAAYAMREAGAVVVAKTVTTEFAATQARGTRNPHDLSRTPGGSSSGSAAAVGDGMLSAALGSQVIGSIIRPAAYCGAYGYKPSVGGINRGGSFDGFSQSCTGVIAATLAETWATARAITARAGGDAGYVGITGPMALPAAEKPKRVAILETSGWAVADDAAKAQLDEARERLAAAGIEIADRRSSTAIEMVESVIVDAMKISRDINAWEGRWPLNTYARDMDRNKLSPTAQERLNQAESMTQEQFTELLAQREDVRRVYATLRSEVDFCMTLSAPGAAPVGIESTGNPVFTVPTSLLGVPTITLPLLEADGLPLGLQVIGFQNGDAGLFAGAGAVQSLFQ